MTMNEHQVLYDFLGKDPIAVRTAHALLRNGISTPDELRAAWKRDPEKIRDFRMIGETCIRRIEDSVHGVPGAHVRTAGILSEVAAERRRQIELWGDQHFPLVHRDDPQGVVGPLDRAYPFLAEAFKYLGRELGSDDSWDRVLLEEVFEALAETDPAKMRDELIQVAAVAVKVVEEIDRKEQGS